MGNVLKVEKQQQIRGLLSLGYSYRQIEKQTGVRRETISKYADQWSDDSKAAKVPADLTAKAATKCPPTLTRSNAEEFRDSIESKVKLGMNAQRIYEDLVCEENAQISYDSVKRFVRKLKEKEPKVYARIHSPPGEEAQVDFGQGAPTLKDGKFKKPHLFKMVLSYSRHAYEEVVWRQDAETFIRCHENAFRFFGGVPKIVKLDNLKAGVIKIEKYDVHLNAVYESFAKHWGFIPIPCLPRRPEHKGKIESGIKHTQQLLKGRKFNSLEEQNAFLHRRNKRWGFTRIHGTTKRQVSVMFDEEKGHLKPLCSSFEYFQISQRTVHSDSHIEIQKAYYSVPATLIGKRLNIHYNSKWVKVFNNNEIVAFHRRTSSGCFNTSKEHLPEKKTFTQVSYANYLKEKSSLIGSGCQQWCHTALQERSYRAFRPIQGVLRLVDEYGAQRVNNACERAYASGRFHYNAVKDGCQKKQKEEDDLLIQEHESIRETAEYQMYLELI